MSDFLFNSVSLVSLSLFLLFTPIFMKNTPFELGRDGKYVWAFIFYKEMVLIILPVLLLMFHSVDEFESLRVTKQEDVARISFYICSTLCVLHLFLSFFYRLLTHKLSIGFYPSNLVISERKHYLFALSTIFSGLFLFIFSSIFLNYKHAFIYSFIGEELITVRLANVYASSLPTQLAFLISFSWWIAAIFSGYLLYKKSVSFFILIFVIGLILASAPGDKAPVIQYIMLFVMSYIFFYQIKYSISKLILFIIIYGVLLIFIVYQVVAIQIPGLTLQDFIIYIVERLGVGQMAGVYETLSSEFFVEGSWWHMIPFSHFFVDYPIFSKELMLFTEDYDFDRIGVKNSFFIAEAFGMGGYVLMLFSPIIVSLAYVIKIIIVFSILRLFFSLVVAQIYTLPVVFLSSNLTGDLSSFVFQKSLILIILALIIVYGVKLFISLFFRK